MLFREIEELKKFVPVHNNLSIDVIQPSLVEAENRYLLHWLGDDLLTKLYNAHDLPEDDDLRVLLPHVQVVVAYFGIAMYIPIGQLEINDGGVWRQENEDHKSAHSGQINMLLKDCMIKGYDRLEQLLGFLEDNEIKYPEWVKSTGYKLNKEHFINSSRDFNDQYQLAYGRQTFSGLRQVMDEVEQFTILPCIGQKYFDSLKLIVSNKQTFSSADNRAVMLIKKAVAFYTVSIALEQQHLVMGARGPQSIVLDTGVDVTATNTDSKGLIQSQNAKRQGDQYLKRLRDMLRSDPESYPLYEIKKSVTSIDQYSSNPKIFTC